MCPIVHCSINTCKYFENDKCTKDEIDICENWDFMSDGAVNTVGKAICMDISERVLDDLSGETKERYFQLIREGADNGSQYMIDKYGDDVIDKLFRLEIESIKEKD